MKNKDLSAPGSPKRTVDTPAHRALSRKKSANPAKSSRFPSDTDLFAQISHEVRTPLNSIIGFSEMMEAEVFGPLGHDKYRGYVSDIHQSAQHALSLINDLLDLSKLQAGAFLFHPELVDVNDSCDQCVRAMEPLVNQTDVTLDTDLHAELLPIDVDRRALKQVLLNLLSNALKFTPAGGRVSISTRSSASQIVNIVVEDTGYGMNSDEVVQALTPFQQLPHSTDTPVGTGLGLPLARAFTEANGGTFELTSTPGLGTRITLSFNGVAQGRLDL